MSRSFRRTRLRWRVLADSSGTCCCIVWWRRVDGESWSDTMKRMNLRLAHGQVLFYCQPWSMTFARSQWRYVLHIIDAYPLLWARIMWKYNFHPSCDPESECLPDRAVGRPRQRWDDHIHDLGRNIMEGIDSRLYPGIAVQIMKTSTCYS